MNTSCKQCHYAIYDGNKQVSCQMGRLKKWKEQTKVTESSDSEKEYYIIQGRVCNAYNKWDYISPEEAREKIRLNYALIILGNKEELEQSIDFDVEIPPAKVMLGSKEYGKYKYELTHFLEEIPQIQMEDALAKRCQCEFYIIIEGGAKLSNEFVKKCEKLFNEDLKQFVMVEGENTLKLSRSIIPHGPSPEALKKEWPELCLQV